MKRNGVTAFRDLISSEFKMRDEWFENPRSQFLLLTPTEKHKIKSSKTQNQNQNTYDQINRQSIIRSETRPGASRGELKQSGIENSSGIHGLGRERENQ